MSVTWLLIVGQIDPTTVFRGLNPKPSNGFLSFSFVLASVRNNDIILTFVDWAENVSLNFSWNGHKLGK